MSLTEECTLNECTAVKAGFADYAYMPIRAGFAGYTYTPTNEAANGTTCMAEPIWSVRTGNATRLVFIISLLLLLYEYNRQTQALNNNYWYSNRCNTINFCFLRLILPAKISLVNFGFHHFRVFVSSTDTKLLSYGLLVCEEVITHLAQLVQNNPPHLVTEIIPPGKYFPRKWLHNHFKVPKSSLNDSRKVTYCNTI